MRRNLKTSFILNCIIVVLFLFGMISSLTSFRWMGIEGNLTPETHNFLWFFTVDSNILLAVASLVLLTFEALILFSKRKAIPHWVIVLKYITVTATTLTLLTVMLYLSPLLGLEFWKLFLNNNLIYHLISPVLGIVSLIIFEADEKLEWKVSFLALIPMGLYGIFYVINVYTHLDNGKVNPKYDFYYFASQGIFVTILVLMGMILLTFGEAYLVYYLREKRRRKLSV